MPKPLKIAVAATEPPRTSETPSPVRPPFSPLTPEAPFTFRPTSGAAGMPLASASFDTAIKGQQTLAGMPADTSTSSPTFITAPPPVPISESTNSDAIALRAAISILQIQKEKARKDLETLERVKVAAAAQPERFTQDLLAGHLRRDGPDRNPLDVTFEDHDAAQEEEEDDDDNDEDGESSEATKATGDAAAFEKMPSAQNVFRCPPVNWAKYHVVGAALDRMHEEQRAFPPGSSNSTRPSEHVIAAPHSPFKDQLPEQHPMQTRRGTKKPSG